MSSNPRHSIRWQWNASILCTDGFLDIHLEAFSALLVGRHFLASWLGDVQLERREARFRIGDFQFDIVLRRLPKQRGWLQVMPWRIDELSLEDSAKRLDILTQLIEQGDVEIGNWSLSESWTEPPSPLTEAELVDLMDRNGIGTDASIPQHIQTIQDRGYVQLCDGSGEPIEVMKAGPFNRKRGRPSQRPKAPGRYLVPTERGMALVRGLSHLDTSLCEPEVRALIERECAMVARAELQQTEVLKRNIGLFRGKFQHVERSIDELSPQLQVEASKGAMIVLRKSKLERAANADYDDDRRKDKKRRSRTRSRSARRGRSRSRSREARRLEKEREMEEKRRQEEEEERRRQIEDATRGDRTVMIVCLHHKADERDVYEFFSKNAGKVRDVQIIRDARTGRSKGLAYVEFYLQEATLKALALSGQPIKGQAVRVQPSQAEKNRAAQAAKASIHYTAPRETPLRLYVGGLTDSLANISEEELKKLFSPFGEIEFIDLHRDPYTNKCKGFAFVQFKNASEAREAMTAMNGFQLAGKELKVGIATSDMQLGEGAGGANNLAIGGENLHEDASAMGPNATQPGMLKDANDRLALMQKLQRDTIPGYGGPGVPSNIIVLHGMFNPSQVNLAADPEFFNDIHADVEQECRKYGSVVKVFADQGSSKGDVWVKFTDATSAANCQRALDRRWFAGQQIIAEFSTEAAWAGVVR
ncbi:RBM39 [Symbiodinium pilosum]|uniref:RBM39 protein n=1 Tax=Symbiodinium pilosum TaxID=2952 RepID=A0A812XY91_SYMPI|nr:RBM39 [Symbiodinium pilosum]